MNAHLPPPPPPIGSRPAALSFEHVGVTVTDGTTRREVLTDVTFDVRVGEMVAVMGPSGAGKTTLVEVACGLVFPTAGGVRLLGEPALPNANRWAARRRETVGVAQQRLNLLPGLSALDNVALALDLRRVPRRAGLPSARAALRDAGVDHLASTVAGRLSIGEQQRVAIARAIAGDRPVILADEPSAALDRTSADDVTRLLVDLARAGRAVLLVTHDSQQASWPDRTIVLRDGRIVDRVGAGPAGEPITGPGR